MQVPGELLDDYRWLVSEAAASSLRRAAEHAGSTVSLAQALRRETSTSRAHLVIEQIELRSHARSKFPLADRMFFTRKLLEQATSDTVARYKAARFPAASPVVDLCCGIGGDLLALAQRGPCTGVDRDPVAAILAEANCRALRLCEAAVVCQAAEDVAITVDAGWHIDPDRRAAGRRTTQPADFQPDQDFLNQLRNACPNGAVKLAPATLAPRWWEEQCELEWIGARRECREQVVWFGSLANSPGIRRATMLDAVGNAASFQGSPHITATVALRVGRYVHEPQPSVLAAGLEGALAEQERCQAVAADVGYFTSDQPAVSTLLTSYEVLDVLPLDRRRIKAALRALRIGRVEVKQRGCGIEPAAWQRSLRGDGEQAGILIAYRQAERRHAVLAARRVAGAPCLSR